jgi:glycosyltransferase involved in cell wall biosynthesis
MRSLRVLQVVGSMHRGGIETWLMSVLKRIDPAISVDFLVSNAASSPYAAQIEEKRSRIIVCPAHSQPLRYARNLARALRSHGPYNVVHSHLHHLNGLVTSVAAWAGVPMRVAHSHFDISGNNAVANGFGGIRYRAARALMATSATDMLAASQVAGAALFGSSWKKRGRVLLCGIDLEAFHHPPDRNAVRRELRLPEDAIVIGHAGRFVPQKNHEFILKIARVMVTTDSRVHFLLLGDGPTRSEMMHRASSLGLSSQVHFPGARPDVPRIMMGAMDAFVLPSHFEGAPLVMVEAQSAGLPCLYSDVCATETDLVPGLWRRESLGKSAEKWSESLIELIRNCPEEIRRSALRRVEATPFNILKSIHELENLYFSCGRAGHATPIFAN